MFYANIPAKPSRIRPHIGLDCFRECEDYIVAKCTYVDSIVTRAACHQGWRRIHRYCNFLLRCVTNCIGCNYRERVLPLARGITEAYFEADVASAFIDYQL